jgi:hypothetical protein
MSQLNTTKRRQERPTEGDQDSASSDDGGEGSGPSSFTCLCRRGPARTASVSPMRPGALTPRRATAYAFAEAEAASAAPSRAGSAWSLRSGSPVPAASDGKCDVFDGVADDSQLMDLVDFLRCPPGAESAAGTASEKTAAGARPAPRRRAPSPGVRARDAGGAPSATESAARSGQSSASPLSPTSALSRSASDSESDGAAGNARARKQTNLVPSTELGDRASSEPASKMHGEARVETAALRTIKK